MKTRITHIYWCFFESHSFKNLLIFIFFVSVIIYAMTFWKDSTYHLQMFILPSFLNSFEVSQLCVTILKSWCFLCFCLYLIYYLWLTYHFYFELLIFNLFELQFDIFKLFLNLFTLFLKMLNLFELLLFVCFYTFLVILVIWCSRSPNCFTFKNYFPYSRQFTAFSLVETIQSHYFYCFSY